MMNEDKDLTSVRQYFGSKVAGMLACLKKLFEEKPDSRVIIFSLVSDQFRRRRINTSNFSSESTQLLGNIVE